jgi:predicted alpha/beta-hydrolase family hydrolase
MKNHNVSIPVGKNESVSGVLCVPENDEPAKTSGVIIAHGAANDMNNALIKFISRGLCHAGYLTLRFNFPYSEGRFESASGSRDS